MSLVCPNCESPAFRIVDSVECKPSGFGDENTIQRACCPACNTQFFCTYSATLSFNYKEGLYRCSYRDKISPLKKTCDRWLAQNVDICLEGAASTHYGRERSQEDACTSCCEERLCDIGSALFQFSFDCRWLLLA